MCSSFTGIIPLIVRIRSTVDLGAMFGGITCFNSSFRMEVPKKEKKRGETPSGHEQRACCYSSDVFTKDSIWIYSSTTLYFLSNSLWLWSTKTLFCHVIITGILNWNMIGLVLNFKAKISWGIIYTVLFWNKRDQCTMKTHCNFQNSNSNKSEFKI